MTVRPNIPISIALQKTLKKRKVFNDLHQTFMKGLKWKQAKFPQAWLKSKGLTSEDTGAGFNAAQFRFDRDEEFIEILKEIGFLKYSRRNSNNVDGHKTFGNYGIMFPLRDLNGHVVNFYAIRIKTPTEEHSFLNGEGIYPCFPHEMTTRLIITTSVMDAASLLQAKILGNRDSVICVPNGIVLKQHEDSIKRLTQLKSILFIQSPKVIYKEMPEPKTKPIQSA